jgi:hypothetical protein
VVGRNGVVDGVIGAVATLVGSAVAWVVAGDGVVEHMSFDDGHVVVVDNVAANDGGGGGDGDGLSRPAATGMAACNVRWSHSLTVAGDAPR